jgi:hypothetical protein
MSEMVERVVRAICPQTVCRFPEDCDESCINREVQARAAIEALREPTGPMVDAIRPVTWNYDDGYALRGWQAGIDAALARSEADTISELLIAAEQKSGSVPVR